MNWKVRIKNPYFWLGIAGLFVATVGIDMESLTSWPIILEVVKDFIANPIQISTFLCALIGVLVDPTTSGVTDSALAKTYDSPKKDEE